jgi:EAL domain-containing protein (putative c-di-GMP-specific phosphodiesterase class I)
MKTPLLEAILDNPTALSVRFQPIFRFRSGTKQIDSLEGLVRGPHNTNFESADILFDYVRRKRAESAIDRVCITNICRAVVELPADLRINLNVHASTLGQNPTFVDFFRRQMRLLSLPLDRFTLEIVEHAPVHNDPGLTCSIRSLRDLGVRIALDDVGLGNSNYRMILDCRPDYFKLDAHFVQGVRNDPDRRAVVKSILCLADAMKGSVVAEGVRSDEDLATLVRMGVELFQANILCPATSLTDLAARGFLGTPSEANSSGAGISASVAV